MKPVTAMGKLSSQGTVFTATLPGLNTISNILYLEYGLQCNSLGMNRFRNFCDSHLNLELNRTKDETLEIPGNYQEVTGMRISKMIRVWIRHTIQSLENYSNARDNYASIAKAGLTFAESIKAKNSKGQTGIDKFLADNITVAEQQTVKIFINGKWPRFRGMFGDRDSCYYPGHDYGWCWQAVEEHGWVIRIYSDSVSDEQIKANPDNPYNVDDPQCSDELCINGVQGVDGGSHAGCIGRAIVLPTSVEQPSISDRLYSGNLAVVNCYTHKGHGYIKRERIADWLKSALESDDNKFQVTHNASTGDYDEDERQWYINGDLGSIISEDHLLSPSYRSYWLPPCGVGPDYQDTDAPFPEENNEVPF